MNDYSPLIGNQLILQDTGSYEDCVEGGCTSVYIVLYSNVDEKTGILEYETRWFPSTPSFKEEGPSEEHRASIPRPGSVSRTHINDQYRIRDDEVEELRDRGVNIKIIRKRLTY